MSYSNYSRFNFARYNEAHRLLDNPDTFEAGAHILHELLNKQPSIGPWLRMKCHTMLAYHADDFIDAEAHVNAAQRIYDVLRTQPAENCSEQRAAQLPGAGRDIDQARHWAAAWRQNFTAAVAARRQGEAASQEIQEKALTEIVDEHASMEDADKADDDENIQPAQNSAT